MNPGKNQGEGDKESARHFNEDEHKFVKDGKVKKPEPPKSAEEARELEKAEQAGRNKAKG